LQDRMSEAILIEAGCDAAQGFLLGKPLPENEITPVLKAQADQSKSQTQASAS